MRPGSQAQSPLLTPEIFANPYPIYDLLRTFDPLHWDPGLMSWIASTHAGASTILHDPRFQARRGMPVEELEALGFGELLPLIMTVRKMILFQDPPDHTRLRGLVNKAFTPRVVEGMRGNIQQLVDDLLDRVQDRGSMDVIADLAIPLPTTVIAIMLGVPAEDQQRLKKWSDDFGMFLGNFTITPEQLLEIQKSVLEFVDYFRGLAAEVRKHPTGTLLSGLVNATDQGDRLSEEELWANCILLLAAGHETTTNLIGNGTLALLRNPDQLRKLREDPTLVVSAIEELLRYDSPVQATVRMTGEPLELQGKQIEAGQHMLVLIGSANRDPARFAEPARLDITRADNRHLAFGYGPHFCLGAPLARMEGQIAINAMLKRMPDLRLASDDLHWQENHVLHGLKALPVEF